MSCQNSIFSFLNLLNSDGGNENDWKNLLKDIENEDDTRAFVENIQNELDNNSNNELLLDIVDFIVDFCSEKTVILISQESFLESFLSALRKGTGSSIQVQMKIIFLIQKWGNKENINCPNFKNKYVFLKNNGIVFPQSDFKMKTYDKYINQYEFKREIENFKKTNNNIINNDNFIDINNINDINEFNPNEQINENEKSNDNQNQFMNNNNNLMKNFTFGNNNNENNKNLFNNNNIKFGNNNNQFGNNNNQFGNNKNLFQNNNNQFGNNNNPFGSNNNNNNTFGNNNPFGNNNNNQFGNNNNPFGNNNNNFGNNNPYNNNNTFSNNNLFGNNNNNQFGNNNNPFGNNINNFGNNNPYENNNNTPSYGNPYTFSQNNNNNNKNSNTNNNNFEIINNPYGEEKPNFNNNNMNFLSGDILNDPEKIKKIWNEKIRLYNQYIDQGKYTYNAAKLKEGISEIIDNLSSMDNLITKFKNMNNNQAQLDMSNIKSDMEQTLYRYDNLNKGKNVEPFYSSFDGNNRKYSVNLNKINDEKNSNYVPFNNYQPEDKIQSTFDSIKTGLFNIGSKIKEKSIAGYGIVKEKSVSGYGYIKGKINGNEKESQEEVQKSYYNIPSNNNDYNQKIENYKTMYNAYSTYNEYASKEENKGIINTVKGGLSKVGNSISNVYKKYSGNSNNNNNNNSNTNNNNNNNNNKNY